MVFAKGNPLVTCVDQALATLKSSGALDEDPAAVASEGDRRAGPEVDGRATLEGSRRAGTPAAARRGVLIALASTVVFFAVVGVAITHVAGLARRCKRDLLRLGRVQERRSRRSRRAFLLNVKIFCIAEVLHPRLRAAPRRDPQPAGPGVLPAARARDRLRRLLPRRADDPRDRACSASARPALQLSGVPTSTTSSGGSSRSCSSTRAYVSEVYRAGIESVHPRQEAAARSLGSRRWQTLRYVILPQAVRRVIPPLLNDFIGLQKDTALVGDARRDRGVPAGARSTRTRPSTTRRTWSRRCSSSRSRSRSRASPTG